MKPHKILTHSAHSEIVISILSIGCLIVRLHEILFQTDAENFSFLSYKTKKFLFLKRYNLGRSQYQNKKGFVYFFFLRALKWYA